MLSVYAATNAAIECLATGLRDELRPDKIRIATLRCGNIAENSGFGDNWSVEVKAAAFELWNSTGHLTFVGPPVPQSLVAQALTNMLCLAPSGGADLVDSRALIGIIESPIPAPNQRDG